MASQSIMAFVTRRVTLSIPVRHSVAISSFSNRAFHVSARRLEAPAPQFVKDYVRRHKQQGFVSFWELNLQKELGPDWKSKLSPEQQLNLEQKTKKREEWIADNKARNGENWFDEEKETQLKLGQLSRDIQRLKKLKTDITTMEGQIEQARARADSASAEEIDRLQKIIDRNQESMTLCERTLTDCYGDAWRELDPADLPEPIPGRRRRRTRPTA